MWARGVRIGEWRLFPTNTGVASLPLFTGFFSGRGCHSYGIIIVGNRICGSHGKDGYERDVAETQPQSYVGSHSLLLQERIRTGG